MKRINIFIAVLLAFLIGINLSSHIYFYKSFASGFIKKQKDNIQLVEKLNFNNTENLKINQNEFYFYYNLFNQNKKENNIRIASFNLLSDSIGFEGEPAQNRFRELNFMLKTLNVDVLGVQELSRNWFKLLNNFKELKFISPKKTELRGEMTTLMYNPRTLTLIDKGEEVFSKYDDLLLRRMVWGVFQKKGESKTFAVINTHFNLSDNDNEIALNQAYDLIKICEKLYEKYNCDIFALGDFNIRDENRGEADITGPVYDLVVSRLYDCKYLSENVEWGSEKSAFSRLNDHIFLMGESKIKVKKYSLMSQWEFKNISDHFLIYMDFNYS